MGEDPRREALRRAYELSRLRAALPWALPGLLLAGVASGWGSALALPLGPIVAVLLVGLRWRGGEPGRGAIAGLFAGTLSYGLLGVWCQLGACGGLGCGLICGVSGVLAALVLARGLRARSRAWSAGALSVASLVIALPAGVFGIVGSVVVFTLWGLSLPLAVARTRSA